MKKAFFIVLFFLQYNIHANCDSMEYVNDLKGIVKFAIENINQKEVKNDVKYFQNYRRLLIKLDSLSNKYKSCSNRFFYTGIKYLRTNIGNALMVRGSFLKGNGNDSIIIHLSVGPIMDCSDKWLYNIDSIESVGKLSELFMFNNAGKDSVAFFFESDSIHKLYLNFFYDTIHINLYRASMDNYMLASAGLKDVYATLLYDKLRSYVVFVSISLGGITLLLIFTFFQFKKNRKQKSQISILYDTLTHKNQEITDSINYAQRIQRSLLASDDLLSNHLPKHFILFQPKDVVSGDFYWATELSNGTFALVTADSTGHGVPGALMSILNVSCIEKAIESEKLTSPSDILNHTRTKIIETLKKDGSAEGGKDGMDASLICFDFQNKKMTYATANNPIWIVRNSELIELRGDKMPVGKHDRDTIPFTQHEVEIQKGDMIYTLTDGFPDQFGGPKGKKFMYKKLKELLISIAHKSTEEQQSILKDTLKNWMGSTEQVDDVTIIGIKI